ncbi:MAG TPA: hypothetical protein VMO26_06660 [Vicinamibacterales bacterium]|nr:hypothetical protein [Vicinamibacterales bacterium]
MGFEGTAILRIDGGGLSKMMIFRDLRVTLQQLRSNPGFAAAAILSLAQLMWKSHMFLPIGQVGSLAGTELEH